MDYSLTSEELKARAKERTRDEAVNVILKKVEVSAVVHSPYIAAMIEVVRQSYNHRDYLYAVAKELASDKTAKEKMSNIRELTIQEIKKEMVGCLESRGVPAVSSLLKGVGVFSRPLGPKGPQLSDQQSGMLQTFFEWTLNEVVQGQ